MEILKKSDNDSTISGIPLIKIYGPGDIADLDYERDLGAPGQAPFTRGAYPDMYRAKLWRIFQLSGYGTAEDERDRILYLLKQGETGFIMESDMSTWYLYDVDHSVAFYGQRAIAAQKGNTPASCRAKNTPNPQLVTQINRRTRKFKSHF